MKTNPILDTTMKGYEMTPALSVLELNAKHPPLDKKEVRQAIAYAIDRKVILRDVMYGYGRPATGPLSRPLQDRWVLYRRCAQLRRCPTVSRSPTSCSTARACRAARMACASPFISKSIHSASNAAPGRIFETGARDRRIDLTLRSEDTATWLRRVYTDYDYDINEPFLSQGVDPVYGLNKQYLTSQIRKGVTFVNDSFYANPEFDNILNEAMREPITAGAPCCTKKAQQILARIARWSGSSTCNMSRSSIESFTITRPGRSARSKPSNGPGWKPKPCDLARYMGYRLVTALPVIFGIMVLNFLLIHLAPGDAASVLAGESGAATPEYMDALRHKFGLDQSLGMQS